MDSKEDNNIKIKKVDDNYFKEYYLKHKEKISEKIPCEHCNKMVSKGRMNAHRKTDKCKLLLTNKIDNVNYFKEYYINNKFNVISLTRCEHCDKMVSTKKFELHQKTLKCQFQKLKIENETLLNQLN